MPRRWVCERVCERVLGEGVGCKIREEGWGVCACDQKGLMASRGADGCCESPCQSFSLSLSLSLSLVLADTYSEQIEGGVGA